MYSLRSIFPGWGDEDDFESSSGAVEVALTRLFAGDDGIIGLALLGGHGHAW